MFISALYFNIIAMEFSIRLMYNVSSKKKLGLFDKNTAVRRASRVLNRREPTRKDIEYMAVINILSPHVADMIAAGEVVERPASVIKELMENSFDAGAKNISVEIRGGGATYIRVTDDGCGMAPEDAGVAFLRHATSKLADERGLEAIATMGFRGEALAAISAVSHIELNTRRQGDNEGTRVTLTAGDIQEMTPCGCPVGTTMVVRDIFYNTPARLKFLKSDRSEAGACSAAALRCALGRPGVSVRLIRDGSEEFFSPGDGRIDSAIYTLLGRELATSMLEVKSEDEGMKVTGFVSSPSAGRGSRNAQYFYCNGRYIRSPLLQSAVEQAYKNTLLTGRFPACVLYLDLSCASVDVNVHPAKTEVKFSYERKVFDLVYHAVFSALTNESRTAAIELSPSTRRIADAARHTPPQSPTESATGSRTAPIRATPGAASGMYDRTPPHKTVVPTARGDFYKSMTAEEFRRGGYAESGAKSCADAPKRAGMTATPGTASVFTARTIQGAGELVMHAPQEPYQTHLDLAERDKSTQIDTKIPPSTEELPKFNTQSVENSVQNVENSYKNDYKIIGEAMKTYIIVEIGEELVLIDKHAAHERMIFDRLKEQKREIMSQQLLTPITLRPGAEDAEIIEKNAALFTELGFELERFGEDAFVLRTLPADMLASDGESAVEELCDKIRHRSAPDAQSARDELLHTVACKAAIKAGWDNDERELKHVADAVLSEQVKYCPHGRPVSVTLTRRELDKLFKRIV